MADIRQNDSGFIVRLYVQESGNPIDVSTSTNTIVFSRPTGAPLIRAAGFFTNGTDGIIEYLVLPNEINQRGAWRIQAHCVFPGGLDVRSVAVPLNVEASSV